MKLDLELHCYALLKKGIRVAFFSTLATAADSVFRRPRFADSVEYLPTGQTWTWTQCRDIAQERTVMGRAA